MESLFALNSVLVILLLIIPSIFFRRFYYTGKFNKQFGFGAFTEKIVIDIFWGVLIQTLSFALVNLFVKSLNFIFPKIGLKLIPYFSFQDIKATISTLFGKVENNLTNVEPGTVNLIFKYYCFTILVAMILGWFLHKIVRLFRLDIKYTILRFSNTWHYYFSGEILSTQDFSKPNKDLKIFMTEADILADTGNGSTTLYSGILTQYTISPKTGELEYIFLTDTKRWKNATPVFIQKDVPGDCFIIPNSKIININLRYFFEVVKQTRFQKFIYALGVLFSVFLLGFSIAFPWLINTNAHFVSKFISTIFLCFNALLIMGILVGNTKDVKNKTAFTITSIVIISTLLFFSLLLLKIIF